MAPVNGLVARVEVPTRAKVGEPFTATLILENVSDAPVRLYWIASEPFRFHSTFFLRPLDGGPFGVPEPARAHGFEVTEADFPLIAPGASLRSTQRVLTRGLAAGRHTVEWDYENTIDRWAGGRQTLDGPTRTLFGGGPIPHIFLGKLAASAPLVLE